MEHSHIMNFPPNFPQLPPLPQFLPNPGVLPLGTNYQGPLENFNPSSVPRVSFTKDADDGKDSDGASSQRSSSSDKSVKKNKRKPEQPTKASSGFVKVKASHTPVKKSNDSDRPYVCMTCLKSFTRSHHLTRHEYTHTGERPFICPTCGKSFVRKHKLTVHIRSHTGERPYTCGTCGKGFSSSEKRKLHYRTHTGEKPYGCDICEKCFTSSSQLKRHRLTHEKKQEFSCLLCPKKFLSEFHLGTHKANIHRIQESKMTEGKVTDKGSTERSMSGSVSEKTETVTVYQNSKLNKDSLDYGSWVQTTEEKCKNVDETKSVSWPVPEARSPSTAQSVDGGKIDKNKEETFINGKGYMENYQPSYNFSGQSADLRGNYSSAGGRQVCDTGNPRVGNSPYSTTAKNNTGALPFPPAYSFARFGSLN